MTENIFLILAITGGVILTCYFLASVLYHQVKKYIDSRNGITTIPEGYEFEGPPVFLEFDPTPERIKPMAAPYNNDLYEIDPISDSVKVDGIWLSRKQLENKDINNYMVNNNLAAIAHGKRITTEQFNRDNNWHKSKHAVNLKRRIDI